MNLYQTLIARLKQLPDAGGSIKYCTSNAWSLQEMYQNGSTIDELYQLCLQHK